MNWKDRYKTKKGCEFKEGDRVMIRGNLNTNDEDIFGFNDEMVELAGRIATITAVGEDDDIDEVEYRIDLDSGQWMWSNGAFE